MPNLLQRLLSGFKMPRARPFSEMGTSGAQVIGGTVRSVERNSQWIGQQKYVTSANIATNVSIVAAGVHHFLNLIAHPRWSVSPKDDSAKAKQMAEFMQEVIDNCNTPWPRIVRRAGMYRFYGFGIQEWTARKRDDGKAEFKDIEARPQFTIEKWDVAEDGSVNGVFQRSPQTGVLMPLPRQKIVYMVDDTLSDSPEGLGIFRHLAEPYDRLVQYLALETRGFERDLRGTPIGRAPYKLINEAVEKGELKVDDAKKLTEGLEAFVKAQVKSSDTGMVLDSAPYESLASDGTRFAGALQWGVELLTGNAAGLSELASAIDRLQREMARIIGVEHLMMGDQGGNRALALDKSRNLYLIANSVLTNIAATFNQDLIEPIWALNGFDDDLRPQFTVEDVAFKDVAEVTSALRDMATAGAVLSPNDPAINEVRDLLGLEHAPEQDPTQLALGGEGLPGMSPDNTDNAGLPTEDQTQKGFYFFKWDESQHPRTPKGSGDASGEFRSASSFTIDLVLPAASGTAMRVNPTANEITRMLRDAEKEGPPLLRGYYWRAGDTDYVGFADSNKATHYDMEVSVPKEFEGKMRAQFYLGDRKTIVDEVLDGSEKDARDELIMIGRFAVSGFNAKQVSRTAWGKRIAQSRPLTKAELDEVLKADWDESEHPRDEFGRFTRSGAGRRSKHWRKSLRLIGHSKNGQPSGRDFTVYDPFSNIGDKGHYSLKQVEKRIRDSSVRSDFDHNERDALSEYASGSAEINGALRKGVKLNDYLDGHVKGLDSAIKKSRLSEGVVTFRGMSATAYNNFVLKAKVGGTFTDPGFVSTSFRKHVANGFTNTGHMMAIRIPKGSKALPMHVNGLSNEYEVLIARGAKFKVLRISGGNVVVKLEKTGTFGRRKMKKADEGAPPITDKFTYGDDAFDWLDYEDPPDGFDPTQDPDFDEEDLDFGKRDYVDEEAGSTDRPFDQALVDKANKGNPYHKPKGPGGGQFTGPGGSAVVYHGTAESAVSSIMRDGLKPAGQRNHVTLDKSVVRVFTATTPESAYEWATMKIPKADRETARIAVLKVTLPADQFKVKAKLHGDGVVSFSDAVAPEHISLHGYAKWRSFRERGKPVSFKKAGDGAFYVALIVNEGAEKAGNPYHKPKGPGGGQFTSASDIGLTDGPDDDDEEMRVGVKSRYNRYDFADADVTLPGAQSDRDHALSIWNDEIGVDPIEFKGTWLGGRGGTLRLMTEGDSADRSLILHSFITDNGVGIGTMRRTIDFNDLSNITAHHDLLSLEAGVQGTGVARDILYGQVKLYERMGVKRIALNANIEVGGYAWAKYGFAPTHAAWPELQNQLDRRLDQFMSPTNKDYAALKSLINDPHPESIWAIADHKIGKKLLLDTSWDGELYLGDKRARARFDTYIMRRK